MELDFTLYETRVLGALIEKEVTTPDQYPLSLNALCNACNQKSNREPVMELDELTVQETVDELSKKRLIKDETGYGSRVAKYKHRFCNTEFGELKLSEQELGIICVLFLRGPQTPGELRSRTSRLCSFSDVHEVETVLNQLANREEGPFVLKLKREPGKRESRYAHLFSGEVDPTLVETATPGAIPEAGLDRVGRLERQVDELKHEIEQIKQQFARDEL